jgi:nicotinamide-nucleotide amidase
MIKASLITIGDEILIGQIIDTNSSWLGQELNLRGIWVNRRFSIGDVAQDIKSCIDQALAASDLVIITGGLGPTADDITKPILCSYFGGTMIQNQEVKDHVIQYFTRRNRPILDTNVAQANVPSNCKVLWNAQGTAPGMLFEHQDKIIISLPGVPFEMKAIMTDYGFPAILSRYSITKIIHRTALLAGKGESFVAAMLQEYEASLPSNIKLAYLPKLSILRLRLTGIEVEESEIDHYFQNMCEIIAPYLIAQEDIEIEEAIYRKYRNANATIAIAESCTGGGITSRLTTQSGSSEIIKGGIVAYTNEAKINHLDIDVKLIDEYSAVSREVAGMMAQNIRKKYNSTIGISITGYLEHEDSSLHGLIFIGIADEYEVTVNKELLPYKRLINKELAEYMAMRSIFKALP